MRVLEPPVSSQSASTGPPSALATREIPALLKPLSNRQVGHSFPHPSENIHTSANDDVDPNDNLQVPHSRSGLPPRTPSYQSVAPSTISTSQPKHATTFSVVSLGLAVRYASAPYGVSKIISVIPRYLFYSRLPFALIINDVKPISQTLKLGVSRYAKERQVC